MPQGSILGPLLFVLYINDLSTIVKNCQANLYADDTEIHSSSNTLDTLNSQIQQDLDSIGIWMSSNKLRVNSAKTVSMLIGPHQKIKKFSLDVSLNGDKIDSVSSTKYLGVYIDCHLNWNDHVNYTLQRVRGKLAALTRLRPLTPSVISLLYKAFIVPIYDYCDAVWQPSSARLSSKIDSLHNRAMRLIASPTCNSANLPSSPSVRRRFHVAVQAYKVLHGLCPPYLGSALNFAIDVTQRVSKNTYRAYVPYVRTNFAKNSFYFRSTSVWNSLTLNLHACIDIIKFKKAYKSTYMFTDNDAYF